MNTNNNPVRKSIILIIVFFIAFSAMVTMACDENPCADGTACGITAPVTNVEQSIIDTLAPEQENLLSGGN